FHGAALELSEDLEKLLGSALLELDQHVVGGLAGESLAKTDCGPTGGANRQGSQPRCAVHGSARNFAHYSILHDQQVRFGTTATTLRFPPWDRARNNRRRDAPTSCGGGCASRAVSPRVCRLR